jgi:5,10-methylene-tetrahydrofolate dehydrogenase/methenyl tetrahydrofolate cyclohydrolase
VISAVGIPALVRKEWIKADSILVDVGTNFVSVPGQERGVLCGDVEFCEETLQKV